MMSLFPLLRRRSSRRCGFTFLLLLLGLTLESREIEAQSGRRADPPSSSATPTPAMPATGNINAEAEKPLHPGELPTKVRLLVARQPTSKHLHTEDQIFASFVKQLNRYENIEATSVGDIKEGQAVERAKAETDAFVVLLRFDIDNFQGGTIIMNSPDLQIDYSVLAPQTGKKQAKGKVYFQAIGGGRMRRSDWPNGTPIKITPEGTGIEAADGLYFWLKLAAMKKARQ
jgi:hypothetical protein